MYIHTSFFVFLLVIFVFKMLQELEPWCFLFLELHKGEKWWKLSMDPENLLDLFFLLSRISCNSYILCMGTYIQFCKRYYKRGVHFLWNLFWRKDCVNIKNICNQPRLGKNVKQILKVSFNLTRFTIETRKEEL